jgi:three prime repair exonuclease-1
MSDIATLVYFDLEATGLKSSGKPRICEISLLAVNTQDVLDLNKKMMEILKTGRSEVASLHSEDLLPRIVNKLTLCVYPMATIVPLVSDLTGLDNYNLTGQSKFSRNTGYLINSFLSCLPFPVCLVAHNGNAYDFALLKSEMENVGTHLNPEILCADSYIGIKEIFANRGEEHSKNNVEAAKIVNTVKMEMDAATDLLKAGVFETEMAEGQCDGPIATSNMNKISKEENELTPNRTRNTVIPRKPKKSLEKFQRKLNFANPSKPTSYSLINLHHHLLGYVPRQSHGAEADCLALLRTTAVLGGDWIDWVRGNCYLFENCKKMWG